MVITLARLILSTERAQLSWSMQSVCPRAYPVLRLTTRLSKYPTGVEFLPFESSVAFFPYILIFPLLFNNHTKRQSSGEFIPIYNLEKITVLCLLNNA